MVYASSEVCGVYGYVPGHEEWYIDFRSRNQYASSEVYGEYGYVPGHEEEEGGDLTDADLAVDVPAVQRHPQHEAGQQVERVGHAEGRQVVTQRAGPQRRHRQGQHRHHVARQAQRQRHRHHGVQLPEDRLQGLDVGGQRGPPGGVGPARVGRPCPVSLAPIEGQRDVVVEGRCRVRAGDGEHGVQRQSSGCNVLHCYCCSRLACHTQRAVSQRQSSGCNVLHCYCCSRLSLSHSVGREPETEQWL